MGTLQGPVTRRGGRPHPPRTCSMPDRTRRPQVSPGAGAGHWWVSVPGMGPPSTKGKTPEGRRQWENTGQGAAGRRDSFLPWPDGSCSKASPHPPVLWRSLCPTPHEEDHVISPRRTLQPGGMTWGSAPTLAYRWPQPEPSVKGPEAPHHRLGAAPAPASPQGGSPGASPRDDMAWGLPMGARVLRFGGIYKRLLLCSPKSNGTRPEEEVGLEGSRCHGWPAPSAWLSP